MENGRNGENGKTYGIANRVSDELHIGSSTTIIAPSIIAT